MAHESEWLTSDEQMVDRWIRTPSMRSIDRFVLAVAAPGRPTLS